MGATDLAIAAEWPVVLDLLPKVVVLWPDVTPGEVIHVAVRMGSQGVATDAWDAGIGVVALGLQMMLDEPDTVRWVGVRRGDPPPNTAP